MVFEMNCDPAVQAFMNSGPVPQAATYRLGFEAASDDVKWLLAQARAAFLAGNYAEMEERYCQAKARAQTNGSPLPDELVEGVDRERYENFRRSPLYIQSIALIRRLLSSSPNMLQADLIRSVPESAEVLRQVLYVADRVGDIVREKCGRTYQLCLPPVAN